MGHGANGGKGLLRVAAVGDLHCRKDSRGQLEPVVSQAAADADVLLLAGDLTDFGLAEEARVLVQELAAARPKAVLAVLGNHDYESGQQEAIKQILQDGGVVVLDGDPQEIDGVGFAGVKGFCGGFDAHALQPWGEATVKQFVREAVDEALKLESALAKLRTPHRIVVLHYSPIRGTVLGEPEPILPFLGSSRLEEPINRYSVTAVVHGHAHHGFPEGRTRANVPVYNVSLPLLRRTHATPFRRIDVPVSQSSVEVHHAGR